MKELLEILEDKMPIEVGDLADLRGKRVGLVIIDMVKGFLVPCMGNLAPKAPERKIEEVILRVDGLAKLFSAFGLPILVFRDEHEPGKPEANFPPHCIRGSGEEKLVDELAWLVDDLETTILPKDCFNGFIGGIRSADNVVLNWIDLYDLEALVVVGVCTDICVLQFVQTILSVMNHGLTPSLKEVVVVTNACTTYDLPLAAHPREEAHHIGLYLMAASGAILAEEVDL